MELSSEMFCLNDDFIQYEWKERSKESLTVQMRRAHNKWIIEDHVLLILVAFNWTSVQGRHHNKSMHCFQHLTFVCYT